MERRPSVTFFSGLLAHIANSRLAIIVATRSLVGDLFVSLIRSILCGRAIIIIILSLLQFSQFLLTIWVVLLVFSSSKIWFIAIRKNRFRLASLLLGTFMKGWSIPIW